MPRKSAAAKHTCYVRDKIDDLRKNRIRRNTCQNLPVEYSQDGNRYCLLHYPSPDKTEAFNAEFKRRLAAEDFSFAGIYFPCEAILPVETFEKEVDFSLATFTQSINFSYATFEQSVFFDNSVFLQPVNFDEATFIKNAYFQHAVFEENANVSFVNTRFQGAADFTCATFKSYVAFVEEGKFDKEEEPVFIGRNGMLNLQNTRIEHSDRMSFHSVRLQPFWFINTDARKYIFTDCRWQNGEGKPLSLKDELKDIKAFYIFNANALLTKTCRQLADNYEENKGFEEASYFRQIANESKRLENYRGWKVWSLHWWYWLSSFYGESPLRAGLVLISILFLFAIAFMLTDFQICPTVKSVPEIPCLMRTLGFWEAVRHSLATATFQNIEYRKPVTGWGETWIILEKILAPLQAALLALAIRRKFMR